ncbi:hypothetical protein [Salinisphaera aquimarina]|uniref:Exopolysaccharide biosynthesis operon protein EpsL n=1 Tax=Salinisphaera aquimarina TaxID=2094031 RepID=A0ABV7EQM0_9GAMM
MRRISLCCALLPAIACTTPAFAGALRLSPFVEYGTEYNSNQFSEPESNRRSDSVQRATIGTLASWPVSRQRLVVSAQATRYRYSRFDMLDHSEYSGRGAWEFQLGPLVFGSLSYRQARYLQEFDNRDDRQPDFIREQEPQVDAYVAVSPDWRVHTTAGYLRLDHGLDSQRRFDRRETSATLAAEYTGKPGSVIGAGAEVIDGEYPGRESDDLFSRTFVQKTPFLRLDWKYSGVSRVQGRIGYTERDNSGGSDRDFTGTTGRIAYVRTLSAKTRVTVEFSREIFSVDDVDANFVRDTGGQISLAWNYSPKLELAASAAHREQDYQTLTRAASRLDKVNRFQGELTYRPTRNLAVVFNGGIVDRNSAIPGESYDQWVGGIALRVTLDPPPDQN